MPQSVTPMLVSPRCYDLIKRSLLKTGFAGGVTKENLDEVAHHYLDSRRLAEQIALLEKYTDIEGKFLEVGSGFGGLVVYVNHDYKDKCTAFGIEPSVDAYEEAMTCAKLLAAENGIHGRFIAAAGETLPFSSSVFDLVYSTSVLEHVTSPERVLMESIRVLKKGGLLQFVIPNYGSWWEGHYGLLTLPHLPKPLFKMFVKVMGRDPDYVDTLRFITRRRLEAALDSSREKVEVISWGVGLWEARLRSLEFSEWAALGKLKRWVRLVHRCRLVDGVIWLGKKLHWETPFVLTLRKK